jgi:hypothetical protein
MSKKPTVPPPRPDLIRRPAGRFGWLEDRLLHDDWLARLGPEGTSVLVLLALAADRHGASFYGRERMVSKLGMSRQDVDQGLKRMLDLGLVAHRPWRPGHADGIWQLLPVPASKPRGGEPVSIGDMLNSLGMSPHESKLTHPSKPPDSRAS